MRAGSSSRTLDLTTVCLRSARGSIKQCFIPRPPQILGRPATLGALAGPNLGLHRPKNAIVLRNSLMATSLWLIRPSKNPRPSGRGLEEQSGTAFARRSALAAPPGEPVGEEVEDILHAEAAAGAIAADLGVDAAGEPVVEEVEDVLDGDPTDFVVVGVAARAIRDCPGVAPRFTLETKWAPAVPPEVVQLAWVTVVLHVEPRQQTPAPATADWMQTVTSSRKS